VIPKISRWARHSSPPSRSAMVAIGSGPGFELHLSRRTQERSRNFSSLSRISLTAITGN
jgi:hypothetical protein